MTVSAVMPFAATFSLALWVLLLRFRKSEAAAQHAARFIVGLGLGAALVHVGWLLTYPATLAEHPQLLLNPLSGFSLPFVPLGFLQGALAGLPLAAAIARAGCLLHGCCYGEPSELPWATLHGPGEIARHPARLYEIAALLLADQAVRRSGHLGGAVALMGFGLARLLAEPFRAPPEFGPPLWGPLTMSALWVAAGAWLLPLRQLHVEGRRDLLALRNRIATVAAGATIIFLTRDLLPEGASALNTQQLIVGIVGYGHFLGSVAFGRARMRGRVPASVPGWLATAFALSTMLTLFVLYTGLIQSQLAFLTLLGVAVWHSVENDLMLARAYRGRMRTPPLSRGADEHVLALGVSLVVTWLAGAASLDASEGTLAGVGLPGIPAVYLWSAMRFLLGAGGVWLLARRTRPRVLQGGALLAAALLLPSDLRGSLSYYTVYVVSSLYHLLSFLLFVVDQGRLSEDRALGRRRIASMIQLHLVVVLLFAIAAQWPVTARWAYYALAPSIYVFWSLMHVLQTAWTRGFAGAEQRADRLAASTAL